MSLETVEITIPVEGFENVARLVAGGIVSRLEFGYETVDDVQLAIELVLRSIPERKASTTVSLHDDGRSLIVEIGPVGALSLDQPLRALDGGGIALGESLARLVDSVELDGRKVVLARQLPGGVG